MYAVIESGGKQYRVAVGDSLRVEKLPASAGDKLSFDSLLFSDDAGKLRVGRPKVAGVRVEAQVLEQGKGKKITMFKYRRRKNYRVKQGHRQPFTAIKITAIEAGK